MAALRNPADCVNAALTKIGWKTQVGSLYDGSAAAQLSLSIYGQTRDDLLKSSDWDFAQRSIALELLKQAPAGGYFPPQNWNPVNYPAQPWTYEYAYRDDMIKLRTVKPTSMFVPNFDPSPNVWSIANDSAYTPSRRVILTNVADAIAVYTGRVTDPSLWAPDFAEALVDALGERLAPALTGLEATALAATQGRQQEAEAKMEQG